MLTLIVALALPHLSCGDGEKSVKPYVFPIPLELPNRNDRADQCWLRIEDDELIETVTVYCTIAHAFLRNYIHDYNNRKMEEDNVDVSLWNELPRLPEGPLPKHEAGEGNIKDWKTTTVLDPTVHMRLYVSRRADCRLLMYSRDGMSNYKVDCERILYFINERLSGAAISISGHHSLIVATVLCLFFVYRAD